MFMLCIQATGILSKSEMHDHLIFSSSLILYIYILIGDLLNYSLKGKHYRVSGQQTQFSSLLIYLYISTALPVVMHIEKFN
jgi:hypothetical protein